MNFNSFQQLIARLLLISLFLQSCGGGFDNNPLIPTGEEQVASIQTTTQAILPRADIQPLTGQVLTAEGGHAVTFYKEAGELKANVAMDVPEGFSKTYEGVEVLLEQGAELSDLPRLSEQAQQRRIYLQPAQGNQPAKVVIYKGVGLMGGGSSEDEGEEEGTYQLVVESGEKEAEEIEQEKEKLQIIRHTKRGVAEAHYHYNLWREDFLKLQPLTSVRIQPEKVPMQELMKLFEIKEGEFLEKQVKEVLEDADGIIPEPEPEPFNKRHKIYGQFIICEQTLPADDGGYPGNLPDFKKRTRVGFNGDGLLYQNNSILDSSEQALWALNPKGKMCIFFRDRHPDIPSQVHHTFFFKTSGIGKPVACSGIIRVCKGKIVSIDNDSGRYQPSVTQLLLAAKYLFNKGILDPTISVNDVVRDKSFTLKEMLIFAHSLDLT
ncbi:hypothetical protein Aasi_1223 [Candidatus Amoebophilus asiaticus 5a2]|uniref:Uncharacterized protein n=1 Tax=Amoebophilus asiaticus (strain 5a2) TaxID=452471 RepID=B3ETJ6_AMOA5|nr:hypothetical protein [Candidatus Amoebophilus asiaticus]ACE06548.1 hypothetical protein Aasi_1223 [Candidatus Amoebophilus asiaticus 5a2]